MTVLMILFRHINFNCGKSFDHMIFENDHFSSHLAEIKLFKKVLLARTPEMGVN